MNNDQQQQVILRAIGALSEQVTTYKKESDTRHEQTLEAINLLATQMDRRFDAVDIRFGKVENRLDSVEGRLDGLESNMATRDYVDRRFTRLENKFDKLTSVLVNNEVLSTNDYETIATV